jgi:hypothetical protein
MTSALDGGEWSASCSSRFPLGKKSWYSLDRRLDGPQSKSGSRGEEKNSQPLAGLEPLIIQSIVQCYITELSRLLRERERERECVCVCVCRIEYTLPYVWMNHIQTAYIYLYSNRCLSVRTSCFNHRNFSDSVQWNFINIVYWYTS